MPDCVVSGSACYRSYLVIGATTSAQRLRPQRSSTPTCPPVLQALEPPDEATDLHEHVVLVFERLNRAEAALASRIAAYETVTEHGRGGTRPRDRRYKPWTTS